MSEESTKLNPTENPHRFLFIPVFDHLKSVGEIAMYLMAKEIDNPRNAYEGLITWRQRNEGERLPCDLFWSSENMDPLRVAVGDLKRAGIHAPIFFDDRDKRISTLESYVSNLTKQVAYLTEQNKDLFELAKHPLVITGSTGNDHAENIKQIELLIQETLNQQAVEKLKDPAEEQ